MDALDELLAWTSSVPPTCRGASASGIRSSAGRSTRSTPGGWRLGAHERTAEALAARGAPASARAHHVELAARQGDRDAVAVLREAGEAAAQRAPASAARWFAGALRLLPGGRAGGRARRASAGPLGALAAAASSPTATPRCSRASRSCPEDAEALRVRLTVACAGVEHLLGRHAEAHARLERALAELEDPGSPEAVALMIELAVDGLYRASTSACATGRRARSRRRRRSATAR